MTPAWWYVLVCRDCDDMEIPFASAEERGRWAGEHTRGSGHDRWLVLDLPRSAASTPPTPTDDMRARQRDVKARQRDVGTYVLAAGVGALVAAAGELARLLG